jgi:DNA-binding beta-propeller fold protein YncE
VEGLWIDPAPAWALDGKALGRPEGVAFSRRGDLMALAESDANRVSVHVRPKGAAVPDARPACVLEGPASGIDYPHDVDFSPSGRLLAVANRQGKSLTIYARQRGAPGRYGPLPAWTIRGARTGLDYCDGVKFVPPHGAYLAAANLTHGTITFYRRKWWRRSRYEPRPCFVLGGPETRLGQPDGLAFSPDGALLAAANHGTGTVTVYGRRRGACVYGPEPLAVLGGTPSRLCFPHSVAFSRAGTHLAVSSAGGRHVLLYRGTARDGAWSWSEAPVLELEAFDPAAFDATNRENHQEGGPKGVAFGNDCFAVCNAHFGLRVHRVGPAPSGSLGDACGSVPAAASKPVVRTR